MSCQKLHAHSLSKYFMHIKMKSLSAKKKKKKSNWDLKKYFLFLKSKIGIPKVAYNFHFDVEVAYIFHFTVEVGSHSRFVVLLHRGKQ